MELIIGSNLLLIHLSILYTLFIDVDDDDDDDDDDVMWYDMI